MSFMSSKPNVITFPDILKSSGQDKLVHELFSDLVCELLFLIRMPQELFSQTKADPLSPNVVHNQYSLPRSG